MNVIEYFDRTEIINLSSRQDRRKETESEFMRYGFPINTTNVNFFNAIVPQESQGFPNIGVRGCFLSHMTVVENARDLGLGNVLILEDDICFSKHILHYGAQAIRALESLDWDIAYFGHSHGSEGGEGVWKALHEPMLLAHFYAINGKAMAGFAEFLQQILARPAGHPDGGPMHYDGALNTFRMQNDTIKAYYFSKNLGYQRPSMTNLHEVSLLDKSALTRPVVSGLRHIKRSCMRAIR